jgi:hypothetical protein
VVAGGSATDTMLAAVAVVDTPVAEVGADLAAIDFAEAGLVAIDIDSIDAEEADGAGETCTDFVRASVVVAAAADGKAETVVDMILGMADDAASDIAAGDSAVQMLIAAVAPFAAVRVPVRFHRHRAPLASIRFSVKFVSKSDARVRHRHLVNSHQTS